MSDDTQYTTKGATKPKRGRPKKHIDLQLVEKLAHIQCTLNEIGGALGVSVDTLQRNKDFAVVYKRGAEGGRKSLRRMQFESANRGNVVMQIWLGKQYLGQSDHAIREVRQLPSLKDLDAEQLGKALLAIAPEELREMIEREMTVDAGYSVVKPIRHNLLGTPDDD